MRIRLAASLSASQGPAPIIVSFAQNCCPIKASSQKANRVVCILLRTIPREAWTARRQDGFQKQHPLDAVTKRRREERKQQTQAAERVETVQAAALALADSSAARLDVAFRMQPTTQALHRPEAWGALGVSDPPSSRS
jgi:hypothetical protein